MNVVETTNLTKKSGNATHVDNLSLAVPPRTVYGFLGPNGAGKSTTLKLLLGLIRPTAGSVTLFGATMTEKNKYELLRRTGSLIESPSFYGHLTGFENLLIIAKLKKLGKDAIEEALRTVRLEAQRDKLVKHYSLGMKQRLGLAMALLGNPELLILDEPTNGLDPAGIQEIRELIRSLPETHGMTVLLSSHLLGEIEQIAEHVGIIDHGSLVYQGTLADLDPKGHDLERVFLALTKGSESL